MMQNNLQMIHGDYNSLEAYFHDAVSFLKQYDWLFSCTVTEILVEGVLNKIPQDWCEALLTASVAELNQLPEGYIKDEWPDTLKHFCEMCHKITLKTKFYEAEENECYIPPPLCRNLSDKKLHQISHLAQLVHEECSSNGIRRIVDFGSGMGYIGQLLHERYCYSILGLELSEYLVVAATERQKKICDATQVMYSHCNVTAENEDEVITLIQEKLPLTSSQPCHVFHWSKDGAFYNLKTNKKTRLSTKLRNNKITVGKINNKMYTMPFKGISSQHSKNSTNSAQSEGKGLTEEQSAECSENHKGEYSGDTITTELADTITTELAMCTDNTSIPLTTLPTETVLTEKSEDAIGIIGLHACADLSVNATKIFTVVKNAKCLIILPCCYHKMGIKCVEMKDFCSQCKPTFADNREVLEAINPQMESFTYFPMSNILKECVEKYYPTFWTSIQKPFLRLAAQETGVRWKNATQYVHELHSLNLMARAVLYLCASQEQYKVEKKYRRGVRKTENTTFGTILEDILTRYLITSASTGIVVETEILRQKMVLLWEKYKNLCNLAEVYTALQLTVQRVAEGLVLLDKIAFLEEAMGNHISYDLVKVLDEEISPRCYAIIARKL